ncbi:MAG: hypothetical protein MUP76_00645 [Acidimicrobiia bacterium]|nr:hypothetical protein [Acidimicrobiia bacterium]
MPALGVPLYGADILGPYADMPLILMVRGEDLVAALGRIEETFGDGIVVEVVSGEDLFDHFVEEYGAGSTGGLTPGEFPFGIRVAPLDIDTLVEIFNYPEILDLIPG